MLKKLFIISLALWTSIALSSSANIRQIDQINPISGSLSIGGSPANANAVLDVQSTTKAFMPPRMTNAQMLAIPSPTNGMVVYNTDYLSLATYNGTIWTYGFANLQLDFLFSAQMSAAGAVTNLSKTGWVTGCSLATNVFTCAISGFTVAPNCFAAFAGADGFAQAVSTSPTQAVFRTLDTSTGSTPKSTTIWCMKVGVDYISASSNAFSIANLNVDPTAWTPTLSAGWGTTSNVNFKYEIIGSRLHGYGTFTNGTLSSVLASVTLPAGFNIDTTKMSIGNTTSSAGQIVGLIGSIATGGNAFAVTATGTSTNTIYFGSSFTSTNQLIPSNTQSFGANSQPVSIDFTVPVTGRSNISLILGSFQNYNSTPGINNPKIFSASITTTSGVITNNMGSIISSCTAANPTVCTLTGLTVTPNCSATITGNTLASVSQSAASASSITFSSTTASTGIALASQTFNVFCQGQ